MFSKQIEFLAIGDISADVFIRMKDANIHCKINDDDCELCLPFGAKVPFEYSKTVKACGNAGNAAMTAAKLGLRTAIISDLGDDDIGKETFSKLEKNGVVTSLIKKHSGMASNYHFVLWYQSERTILVNHVPYHYRLPSFKKPKWIYLTSTGVKDESYYAGIIDFLDANPDSKLAFQPGTFQISTGQSKLREIYRRADVVIVNMQEAQRLVSNNSRDPKILLSEMAKLGAKLNIITSSVKGAFMYDGDHYYEMPIYPDPRPALERTGCGDAFSATFVCALAKGKSPLEALMYAPVNPMSVAQFVGAQEGLLSMEQLEWWLHRAPDEYKPREI